MQLTATVSDIFSQPVVILAVYIISGYWHETRACGYWSQ
jgi:hypothetical protein